MTLYKADVRNISLFCNKEVKAVHGRMRNADSQVVLKSTFLGLSVSILTSLILGRLNIRDYPEDNA